MLHGNKTVNSYTEICFKPGNIVHSITSIRPNLIKALLKFFFVNVMLNYQRIEFIIELNGVIRGIDNHFKFEQLLVHKYSLLWQAIS